MKDQILMRCLAAGLAAVLVLTGCGGAGKEKESTGSSAPAQTGSAPGGKEGENAPPGGAGGSTVQNAPGDGNVTPGGGSENLAPGSASYGTVQGREGTEAPESWTETGIDPIDMTRWRYNEEDDVFYQLGILYCEAPEDDTYETLGYYVPASYMDAEENGDGTWTCTVNYLREKGPYTADTAPVILPVNTPGYSAMKAPASYDDSFGYGQVSDYTDKGMIVLFAGCRGREHGAPYGVTDLKAAVRFIRNHENRIPGAENNIYALGMSGGGAQTAILGASGDSPLYYPYLEEIGAVMDESDAIQGAMCWCPVTNLDLADEAYEWNMGVTRIGLSDEEQRYSDGMAESFGDYINALGIKDPSGETLSLQYTEQGFWQAGSYYDYIVGVAEKSLEHFLKDTSFPYDADEERTSGPGGQRGGPEGAGMNGAGEGHGAPAGGGKQAVGASGAEGQDSAGKVQPGSGSPTGPENYEGIDNIRRMEQNTAAVSFSGVYDTPEDYIAALNKPFHWVDYNAADGTVKITSLADFATAMKPASKGLGAFDAIDASQGENILFNTGDGEGAHFDPVLAELADDTEYEHDFADDLNRKDALGTPMQVRVDMYNPLYYLLPYYKGADNSHVAGYWRIRSGITQGDTALTTEVNLYLALANAGPGVEADFETVWGKGHTMAERSGEAVENFLLWVNQCEGTESSGTAEGGPGSAGPGKTGGK